MEVGKATRGQHVSTRKRQEMNTKLVLMSCCFIVSESVQRQQS